MKTWKTAPEASAVARYVNCYWFLEKNHSDGTHGSPKLNPDPAAHLILSPPQQPYSYTLESGTFSGSGSHLILPHNKTMVMDHSHTLLIFGIKFEPGALYSLRFPSIPDTQDEVIPVTFEELFQLNTFNQRKLTGAKSGQKELSRNYCDTLLTPFFSEIDQDRHANLVSKVLKLLSSNIALAELGDHTDCSIRTVERSFSRVTGFTLKQFNTIQRLENLLDYVHKLDTTEIDWADTAFQFGFSDQPHLIRYLKSSLGTTPGKYARERDLAIDSYGNFE